MAATSRSPIMVTPYFDEVTEYGAGLGAIHNSSVMPGFCHNSNSPSDGADNCVSSAQNCYNTSGASLSEHNPNFVQNFAFQFFPNKEEAANDVESGVSECQSDGASRIMFDRHGRLDNGSIGRKHAVDFSSARGISLKCENNPSDSPVCVKPYSSFDSHLADNDLDRPDKFSSSFLDNKAVGVKVKPEAELEKVVYSSVPEEDSVRDAVYASGETNHWWSGASSCAVSYQTDIEKGYSFMAPQTAFLSQDSVNRSSEYLDFPIQQGDHEYIQPRSIDSNFSNASFESIQSHSSECISDSDDDSDICIIETNGQSTAIPHRPLAMKKPVVSSEYSTGGHTFNQSGGLKLQSNKENIIFQAALQVSGC